MLPLEPTDDRANPAFKTAAACEKWLGQLQLTNLHQAHKILRTQVEEFNKCPLDALERLNTLELLQDTVSAVQVDYARKLAAKKLPLNDNELATLNSLTGLWQAMVTGYRRCLQAYLDGDARLARYGARSCQRCLTFSGAQIFEYLRTGYEFDGKLWRQLHALYALSEAQGFQQGGMPDAADTPASASSCRATYARILLACYAHHAEHPRQHLVERWLTLWDSTLSVDRHASIDEGALPLAVDLDSEQGLQLQRLVKPSDSVRYLNMAPLSNLLRQKISQLQQGESPQQAGLGENCGSLDCETFLAYLHRCWCEGNQRLTERHGASQQTQVCYGMEGCFAYVANKPFKQPDRDSAVDTLSRKQLAAFGRVLSDTNRHDLAVMGHMLETWLLEDESIRGARLLRQEISGVRLGTGQLVAVRPTNANAFVLGTLAWVRIKRSGQLHAGVRYLPGLPQAVAMKATGVNLSAADKYVPALLLPAIPMLNVRPSLIAPRDWFKPERIVEIVQVDKKRMYLKMGFLVERGSDYERISFTEAPPG